MFPGLWTGRYLIYTNCYRYADTSSHFSYLRSRSLHLVNAGEAYCGTLVLLGLSLTPLTAAPPTATVDVLHSFAGMDGQNPTEGFIKASDGNYYAPVGDGDANANGTIIKVTPNGDFSVLHTFHDNSNLDPDEKEGSLPKALAQGADGNLYGVCRGGGGGTDGSGGTFFKFGLDGTFTKLYDFNYNSVDRSSPALW